MRQYSFTSAPMKIGPKEWRIVVYTERDHETEMTTDYEWRYPVYKNRQSGQVIEEASQWSSMRYWPTYNGNDGMFAGCPHTLRKLYEKYQKQVDDLMNNPKPPEFFQ